MWQALSALLEAVKGGPQSNAQAASQIAQAAASPMGGVGGTLGALFGGGMSQPAPAAPVGSVAGQQAITDQQARALQEKLLGDLYGSNVLNRVR